MALSIGEKNHGNRVIDRQCHKGRLNHPVVEMLPPSQKVVVKRDALASFRTERLPNRGTTVREAVIFYNARLEKTSVVVLSEEFKEGVGDNRAVVECVDRCNSCIEMWVKSSPCWIFVDGMRSARLTPCVD
jgi:hypothetical protein